MFTQCLPLVQAKPFRIWQLHSVKAGVIKLFLAKNIAVPHSENMLCLLLFQYFQVLFNVQDSSDESG